MGNFFSDIFKTVLPIASVVPGPWQGPAMALSALTAGKQAANAAQNAQNQANAQNQQSLDLAKQYFYNYQQPLANLGIARTMQMQPTIDSFYGWLQNLGGLSPQGSTYTTPNMTNPAVPSYLVTGLQAPEGSVQRRVAELALYNKDVPNTQQHYQNILADIGRGENPQAPINRVMAQGWQSIPVGWKVPTATIGGSTQTVPTTAQLPSFMQVDWKQPFTPEQIGAMTSLSDVNISDAYKQRQGALTSEMARRGLAGPGATSTADTSGLVGLQNWLQSQQANQRSNLTMAGIQRGDQLRGEQGSNFWNLFNTLQGNAAQFAPQNTTPSMYMNALGNNATNYQNQAANYGNMAGQTLSGLGSTLAQQKSWNDFMNMYNNSNQNQNQPNVGVTGLPSATYMPSTNSWMNSVYQPSWNWNTP